MSRTAWMATSGANRPFRKSRICVGVREDQCGTMRPAPERARLHRCGRRPTSTPAAAPAPQAPPRASPRRYARRDRPAPPTRGTPFRRTRDPAGSFGERARDGVCRVGPARYGGHMAIGVRPATTGDLAAIRRLLGHLHGSSADVAWSSATWGRILGDPNRTVLVAEDRGEFAVGTADVLIVPTLTHDGSPWALVENVVVDPEWRRRGVG